MTRVSSSGRTPAQWDSRTERRQRRALSRSTPLAGTVAIFLAALATILQSCTADFAFRISAGTDGQSVAHYSRKLEKNPTSLWNLVARGQALQALGLHQEAIADFSRVIAIEPSHRWARYWRANSYQQLEKWKEAESDLLSALRLGLSSFEGHLRLGLSRLNMGELSLAAQDLELCISEQPGNPEAHYLFAVVKRQIGDIEGSLELLRTATALSPNEERYQSALVEAQIELRRFDMARDLADNFLLLKPDALQVLALRGFSLHAEATTTQKTEGLEQALRDYSLAISKGLENDWIYSNACFVACALEIPTKAAKYCARASELAPTDERTRERVHTLFERLQGDKGFLVEVQELLRSLGYSLASAPGEISPLLPAVLRGLQVASDLPSTGHPDEHTFLKILRSVELLSNGDVGSTPRSLDLLYPPSSVTTTTDASVRVQALSEGLADLRVSVDGAFLEGHELSPRVLPLGILQVSVPVPPGESLLTLVGRAKDGSFSSNKILVTRKDAAAVGADGVSWAVVIGVSDYEDPEVPDLKFADADAEAVAGFLLSKAGYAPERVFLFTSTGRTSLKGIEARVSKWEEIRRSLLVDVSRNLTSADTLLFYFSGHGVLSSDSTAPLGLAAFLAPRDLVQDVPELKGLSMTEIRRLAWLPPNRVFVVLDACFSGSGQDVKSALGRHGFALKSGPTALTGGFSNGARGKGRVLFASSQDNQPSLEAARLQHGVFTYYLLKHLRAGTRRLADLNAAVYRDVKEFTNGLQEPRLDAEDQQGDLLFY